MSSSAWFPSAANALSSIPRCWHPWVRFRERSSNRSTTGFVLAVWFPSPGGLEGSRGLASFWAARLPAAAAPRVRRSGSGWAVSVPVDPQSHGNLSATWSRFVPAPTQRR